MANWVIDPSKNEGYPSLTVWPPEWETGWTSNDNVRYPDLMWRIKAGVNEGYPWLYPWFQESSTDEGEMEIGGAQTNYPNGFTNYEDGGVRDQFNNDEMNPNDPLIDQTNTTFYNALGNKMFAASSFDMAQYIRYLNDPDFWSTAARTLLGEVYGTNIYDGIISCKMFPFVLQYANGAAAAVPIIYNKFPLGDPTVEGNLGSITKVNAIQKFNMGTVVPHIQQAWELEAIDWSIYLPYAGVFPIDVRNNDLLKLNLYVDVFTGVGEYSLRQNGQVTNCFKCQLGYDFPLVTTGGQMMSNMAGSVMNTVSPLISLAGAIGGAAVGGPAGMAVGGAAGMLSSAIHSDRLQINAPQVGGLTSVYSSPTPRLIARIPKIFNHAFGYEQTLGANRSTTYEHINNCTGFTQTKNYKCDIIVATENEKAEIERLMNAGVML